MDYTLSNSYDTDAGTGNRMHEDSKAVPTAVSDLDMNSTIWSLMEVIKAGGLAGAQFDKATPATYRLLLKSLRNGALLYGVDSGAANAAIVDFVPPIDALTDGMILRFKAKVSNTGATTLNVNGLGAKAVVGPAQSALQGGEILANGKCEVIWNATINAFVLEGSTGGARQVVAGTQSGHAVNLGQFAGTKTTNGYQRLAGGLILQWATGSAQNGAGASNNFPIAFPTACLAIISTHQGTDGSVNIITSALSATGVVFITNYAGAATAVYVALGF